jgi:single-strand DNA-binding protein
MLNRATIMGNLGADPEVRTTTGGQTVATLRIATNEKWKDKEGNPQEKTEWHRVIAWGKTAELCGQYLTKGRQVYVEGRITTREWEKDGEKKYTTEIVAYKVLFIGGKPEGSSSSRPPEPPAPETPEDDFPF